MEAGIEARRLEKYQGLDNPQFHGDVLVHAAQYDQPLALAMLGLGVDPELAVWGKTAMELASPRGPELFIPLLESGARVSPGTPGQEALSWLVWSTRFGLGTVLPNEEICGPARLSAVMKAGEALLTAGADIRQVSADGTTPLQGAVRDGSMLIPWLFAKGAALGLDEENQALLRALALARDEMTPTRSGKVPPVSVGALVDILLQASRLDDLLPPVVPDPSVRRPGAPRL
jgi:hypothetical protein